MIPIHKTESTNSVLGAYVDGPPGTTIIAADLNAIQEELCYVITQSGQALLTTATDTYQQLWTALTSSATLAGMGVTATASELNSVCDNCTATAAELSTTVHTCTASAAEINTACDGTTAKNSHTHILTSGATDLTATFTEINNTVHNCTATAAEVSAVAHTGKYGTQGMILGDTTAGRVLRFSNLLVQDGVTASTITCTFASIFNGDTDSVSNLPENTTNGNFNLSSGGLILTILDAGLTGTPVFAWTAQISNINGNIGAEETFIKTQVNASDIRIIIYIGDTPQNMTTWVDTHSFEITIGYITSA